MKAEAFPPLRPEDAAYLLSEVEGFEPDYGLVLPYVPDAARPGWLAVLAFASEVVSTPGKVSNAMLGRIRLEWWREAVAEIFGEGTPRKHPVVQAMANQLGHRGALRPELLSIIDGMESFLEPGEDETLDEAVSSRRSVYGSLGRVLASLSSGPLPGDALVIHALCRSAPDAEAMPREDGTESPARRFSRALGRNPHLEGELAVRLRKERGAGGKTLPGLPLRLFKEKGGDIEHLDNPLARKSTVFLGALTAKS